MHYNGRRIDFLFQTERKNSHWAKDGTIFFRSNMEQVSYIVQTCDRYAILMTTVAYFSVA